MNNKKQKYLDTLAHLCERIGELGHTMQPALTVRELDLVESNLNLSLPHDFRWYLQQPHPNKAPFIDYCIESKLLREHFAKPLESILFDVNASNYWREDWGPRPDNAEEAGRHAMKELLDSPVLVPITTQCCIPIFGSNVGNPVFSVNQTDIIHRGANLCEFLEWFFLSDKDEEPLPAYSNSYNRIDFWTKLTEENFHGFFPTAI